MTWKCNVCGNLFISRMDAAICHPDVVEVDDGVSQTRTAEQRNEAISDGQKFPISVGEVHYVPDARPCVLVLKK